MRPRRGNWSTQELERLTSLYPRSSESQVARILGRTVETVRRKAEELFRRPNKRGPWNSKEDDTLRQAYGLLNPSALSLVLARSQRDVRQRVRQLRAQLRRGPWTSREQLLLKKVYGTRSDHNLVACLSRPKAEILRMASRLCLSKDKRFLAAARNHVRRTMPRWSPAEVQRLRLLYPHMDNLKIARLLGRSVASIANKAYQLGLSKATALRERIGRRNVTARYAR
ncbi:MAG: hypothetical protein ACYST0_07020 [Planctomycetota bacterium]